jgi:hypothetical protein
VQERRAHRRAGGSIEFRRPDANAGERGGSHFDPLTDARQRAVNRLVEQTLIGQDGREGLTVTRGVLGDRKRVSSSSPRSTAPVRNAIGARSAGYFGSVLMRSRDVCRPLPTPIIRSIGGGSHHAAGFL